MKKIVVLIIAVFCFGNTYCQTAEEYFKNGYEKSELNDFKGAIIDYTKAIELKLGNDAECYYKRGLLKYKLQDFRGASLDMQKAWVGNYDQKLSDSQICLNIGSAMSKYKDFSNAFDFIDKSIEYNPRNIEAYLLRAFIKRDLKDYKGEIQDYNVVLGLDIKNEVAFFSRGDAKAHLGYYLEAIEDFNKVILLDPKSSIVYLKRGLTHLLLNNTNNACLDFSKAGELGSEEAYEMIKKYCN
jgi:tetratricopeptide (TPR) repeat protein